MTYPGTPLAPARPGRPASVRVHDLPDMEGVVAVRGHGVDTDLIRHAHGSHVVGVVDRGARVVEQDGVATTVAPGGLFAVAAGCGHRCGTGDGGPHSYRVLCLAPARLVRALSAANARRAAFATPLLDDPAAARALAAFFALLPAVPHTLALREAVLRVLCQRLARHTTVDDAPHAQRHDVRRALERIDADPAAPHRLADLAALACLSPHHFQRVFLAHTGVSPREMVQDRRIRRARALLERGVSPAAAAQTCGFADQAQFTKAFKSLMGVPPGRYARDNAARG